MGLFQRRVSGVAVTVFPGILGGRARGLEGGLPAGEAVSGRAARLLTFYARRSIYYHMVIKGSRRLAAARCEIDELDDVALDAVFMALADPTRRAILARLAHGEASVNELVEPFALSQPAISKHLKVLERAGLVSGGRAAQRRPRRLEAAPLGAANQWLESYRALWEARYARLDAVLASLVAAEKRPRRMPGKQDAKHPGSRTSGRKTRRPS